MTVAVVQISLGQIALYDGDYERARVAFVACLPMLRELGWRSNLAYGLVRLAEIARAQGDHAQAAAYYAEGLALFREAGDQGLPAVAWALSGRAALALEQGDWTAAQIHLTESLAIAWDTGQVGVSERAPELAGVLEVGQRWRRRRARRARPCGWLGPPPPCAPISTCPRRRPSRSVWRVDWSQPGRA